MNQRGARMNQKGAHMKRAIWMSAAVAVWLVTPHVAAAKSGASCAPAQVNELVASSGLEADGTAQARWQQDDRCRQRFGVEVENVAVGDYALLVGGVLRGSIAVRATPTGTQGEIEFEGLDDTPHPLTLDFDPRGLVIEIRLGADVYFADVFDGSGPAASPTPTRTAIPTAADATPTAAATRTDDRGGLRTATRTRTVGPTRTTAARTATPPRPTRTPTALRSGSNRDSGSGGGWLSFFGAARSRRSATVAPTRTRTPELRGREPEAGRGGAGEAGHHGADG